MTDKGGGFIPLCEPSLQGREWEYIKDCLDTNWVSSVGSYVDRFERMAAGITGRKFGVAVTSGTAALHMAVAAAGIGEGDEVLLPSLTFIAPANAIRYVGAWPVFLDVDPHLWQLDPEAVRRFVDGNCRTRSGLPVNTRTGRPVRAILPVHILGHPVDMDPVMKVAEEYGLTVIEDAAEALGSQYRGKPVGSVGHAACLSFNGNKIVTAGGGGVVVTDNEGWAERIRHLSTQARSHPLEYEHNEVGYNYRLTNLQAALGCAQLESLDRYVDRKRRIAQTYDDAFTDVAGIEVMTEAPWARSTCWMYTVVVEKDRYGMDSRELLGHLADRRIMSRPLWQPMNKSPAFGPREMEPCPVAEAVYEKALSLPCSVGLTAQQQERVIKAVMEGGRSS